MPTAELCRKYGIASQTLCRRKGKYGGMEVSDAKPFFDVQPVHALVIRFPSLTHQHSRQPAISEPCRSVRQHTRNRTRSRGSSGRGT
jgi:hypothetical protein